MGVRELVLVRGEPSTVPLGAEADDPVVVGVHRRLELVDEAEAELRVRQVVRGRHELEQIAGLAGDLDRPFAVGQAAGVALEDARDPHNVKQPGSLRPEPQLLHHGQRLTGQVDGSSMLAGQHVVGAAGDERLRTRG